MVIQKKKYGVNSSTVIWAGEPRKAPLTAQQVIHFLGYSAAMRIKSLLVLLFYHSWISYPY
jgi:hypothetical protein